MGWVLQIAASLVASEIFFAYMATDKGRANAEKIRTKLGLKKLTKIIG